jgi:tol-pal system protein YbgF
MITMSGTGDGHTRGRRQSYFGQVGMSHLGSARSSQFRRSFGYCWRSPAPLSSMMRTMSNRVAFAAIALTCVMAIPTVAFAQVGPAELLVRIDRLENQIRQLTGEIEQIQYRNQQLEAMLRRLQDENEPRSQELGSRGAPRLATAPPPPYPPPQAGEGRVGVPNQPGTSGVRRSDAFDPAENPNAPGVPRVLGSIPPQPGPMISTRGALGGEPTPYGAGPGLPPGADPGPGRLPIGAAPQPPGSTGPYAVATAPPSSPRDILDLGTGYLQHRDYALAEETFSEFLKRYPSDRLAAEAQFGVGESLFLRQNYHAAANAFVLLSKKYESSNKAPDALLRLGQSLAALNEKELACVAFGDVNRKYPRASPSVKQAIEREQKRARC